MFPTGFVDVSNNICPQNHRTHHSLRLITQQMHFPCQGLHMKRTKILSSQISVCIHKILRKTYTWGYPYPR